MMIMIIVIIIARKTVNINGSHLLKGGPGGSEAKHIAYPSQKRASPSSCGPRYHKRGSGDQALVV